MFYNKKQATADYALEAAAKPRFLEDTPESHKKQYFECWKNVIPEDVLNKMLNLYLYKLPRELSTKPFTEAKYKKDYIERENILIDLKSAYITLYKAFYSDSEHKVTDFTLARSIAYACKRLQDELEIMSTLCSVKYKENEAGMSLLKYLIISDEQLLPDIDTVDTVLGIDIETTGLNPITSYIIDVGYENMDMKNHDSSNNTSEHDTNEAKTLENVEKKPTKLKDCMYVTNRGYSAQGAYNQSRAMFGFGDDVRSILGNPTEKINGISGNILENFSAFDEYPNAQKNLLDTLMSAPVVAHNARFEHNFFTANIKGYAENYRDGKITLIDTMSMSKKWDTHDDKAHGSNSLEAYAKRWGALPKKGSEMHLGLEDAHIMLVAMKNHLESLKNQDSSDSEAGKTTKK